LDLCRIGRSRQHKLEKDIKAEDRVGLSIQDPLRMIAAMIAVLKAGAAYVPLDPGYPRERLEGMLQDAAVAHLLTDPPAASIVDLPGVPVSLVDDLPRNGDVKKPVGTFKDQLAYLIYTSGSTGQPKGVGVSHRAAVHSTLARHQYYQAPVRGFLLSSFSFDSSVARLFGLLARAVPFACRLSRKRKILLRWRG
jgi:non-ribosomal peptide synthetase component F